MTRSLLPLCVLLVLACGGLSTPPPPPVPVPAADALEGFAYAPGPNGARFTEWTGGETLFVAGPQPLRDGPGGAGTVVLDLGAEVTVVAPEGDPVEIDGLRNRWVRVRAGGVEGFVFGAHLTPIGGRAYPTMDSDEFPWVVTFDKDFAPLLRIGSPSGPHDLALDPTDRFVGGRIEAETEGWGDFETRYTVALCRVDGGEEPSCSAATARLGDAGLEQTTPPDPWKYLPEAEDVTCAVESTLAWEPLSTPERLRDPQTPAYMRGSDGSWRCVAIGRVTGEVHRGRTVVSCVSEDGGKSAPVSSVVATYLADGDAWIGLPCGSPQGVQSELDAALAADRVTVTHASTIGLADDHFGPATLPAARGEMERAWMSDAPEGVQVPLFDLPGHGSIFAIAEGGDANTAGAGALFLGRPDGTAVRYAWSPGELTWPDEPPTALPYSPQTMGCDGFPERLVNVEEGMSAADLTPIAQTADGTPVGVIADPEHPVNQRLFALYQKLSETDVSMRSEALPVGQDLPTLLAGRPWLFVEDPWGRIVRLMREDFATPQMCEPIVYLYADPPVDFHLRPVEPLTFFRTEPYGPDGWSGTAGPDGTITVAGARWAELFWEGRSLQFRPPADGVTVRGSDAEAVLREAAADRGLIGHELDAFVDAWTPRLARHPWVRIAFHAPADLEVFAPLALDPPADASIRVMLDASVVPGPAPGALPRPDPVPERGAFTLVEWGGVLRDRR